MKIGLVGYQGCGKSTLFEWLTGVAPDPALAHVGQTAMAAIPDPRIESLCAIYHPKKVTHAALEIADTPGLSRTHEGNASRLAAIRDTDCLVMVVPAFGGAEPRSDLSSFDEDLLLADLEIVSKRIQRLRESIKKPRPNREQELAEIAALEPLEQLLGQGRSLVDAELTDEQRRAIRSFRLLSEKPRLAVVNLADNDPDPRRYAALSDVYRVLAVPLALELELARMEPATRAEFERELQLTTPRRDDVLRALLEVSRQILFFTAGEKEVRCWLLPKGATALDAADNIHTDLARHFIRAEVMRYDDLVQFGSERELKARGLVRQEHKDYAVQEGDVLFIKHGA
jgi:ribosome-binding ATPase YchF (GTP1/OBG family)